MTMFDTFAAIVEKHLPEWISIIHEAKVFDIRESAATAVSATLFESLSKEEWDLLTDHFFLPFPSTIVMDENCLWWLSDLGKTGVYGIEAARVYAECRMITNEIAEKLRPIPSGSVEITFAFVRARATSDKAILIDAKTTRLFLATKDAILHEVSEDKLNVPEYKDAKAFMICPFAEIAKINTPSRFILESVPCELPKAKWLKSHIARLHQRATYTLLEPGKIRKLMGLTDCEPTGRHVTPHHRRAHLRMYRDERYKAMRGKAVMIPACWVGPSEAKVGRKTYRVLLDR